MLLQCLHYFVRGLYSVYTLILVRDHFQRHLVPNFGDIFQPLKLAPLITDCCAYVCTRFSNNPFSHNFDGQLHGGRVGYIGDLFSKILELHLGDGVQSEFIRLLVEIVIHGLLDPLPMPGPHRRIFQIGDQWKGSSELVHARSERKILPS